LRTYSTSTDPFLTLREEQILFVLTLATRAEGDTAVTNQKLAGVLKRLGVVIMASDLKMVLKNLVWKGKVGRSSRHGTLYFYPIEPDFRDFSLQLKREIDTQRIRDLPGFESTALRSIYLDAYREGGRPAIAKLEDEFCTEKTKGVQYLLDLEKLFNAKKDTR